jgi:enediyne biosynthesis protein E4
MTPESLPVTSTPLPPQSSADQEPAERSDDIIIPALLFSLAAMAILAVVGGAAAWWWLRAAAPPEIIESQLNLPTARTTPAIEIPPMPFTDITPAAGITFVHENGAYGDKLLPETMGSGCAFFDYDNDGDQDLLLVNSQRWPWDPRSAAPPATLALYENDGHGNFTDVTEAAGLNVSMYGMGVALGDYDADGNVDIFISAVGKARLFRNLGGRFEDVTDQAGVGGSDADWTTSCGWFDYDGDGDLDLMVCRYLNWTKDNDLAQRFQLKGGGRAYGRPQNFGGVYPILYRNNGDGTFTDVSAESGIQVANPATGVPAGKSLGLAFADFDNDGWLDVVIANDTVGNFLFHNQKDGTFREVGALAGLAYDSSGLARGAMGIDIAHFRNSDEQGIAIGNFSNEMTALYVSRRKNLQFRDDAVSNGLGPATRLELTFGIFYFDSDLDGRLDLFAANGHLEEDIQQVQATQRYAQKAHFFWNCGPEETLEYLRVPEAKCGPDLLAPMVGRGAAYADIDGDGDLDLCITASGGPARLLRNDQQLAHHWLRIKLHGRAPNRDAIGAQVELHRGEERQMRLVSPTRSYLSQCELPVTFGLGESDAPVKVVIRWPSGVTSEHADLPLNRLHEITEPEE